MCVGQQVHGLRQAVQLHGWEATVGPAAVVGPAAFVPGQGWRAAAGGSAADGWGRLARRVPG